MAKVSISAVDQYGVIQDIPGHKAPPEGWTYALNMRFTDGRAVRMQGEQTVMDPPSVAPAFVMNVEDTAGVFWLYASAVGAGSKIYGFNSGSHADLSQAGDYTVSNPRDINGVVFQGTPIINNGTDDPQYWASLSLATDFADLSNWPASTTCKVISMFKNFLVALNTVESSTAHGHRVRWSSPAAPGSLPATWDDTDATNDAGLYELSDVNSGTIQWGLPFRDMFAIYKNESTWLMRFVGGQAIMDFASVLNASGVLCPRAACALTLPQQKVQVHFVQNGIDLGVFDGQSFESVIDGRNRKFLVGDIDTNSYNNSFVFDNANEYEGWFCYPSSGNTQPDTACIWNYRDNTITFRDFNGVHAARGAVELAGADTWATVSGAWASATASKWQEGARRKLVVPDRANTQLLQLDTGEDFAGTSYSSSLEKKEIALIGQDRSGNPIADYTRKKLVTRLWVKITGGRVRVTLGSSDQVGEDPDYTGDGSNTDIFDPSEGYQTVDITHEGRLIAVKFEGIDGDHWEIEGFDMELEVLGGF